MYCGPFHIVGYVLAHWEKGYLGIVLALAALLIGIVLATKYQHVMALPFALLIAVCLYFFPTVLGFIMGDNIQQCAYTWHSQQITASNLQSCSPLVASYTTPGNYCSCTGRTPQPTCTPDVNVCQSELINYETTSNSCSCATANKTNSAQPVCITNPAASKPSQTNSLQTQCYDVNSTWTQSAYCANTSIPHAAAWIYPVANGYQNINPHAYYTMQTQINNNTGAPINVSWYGTADDVSWYYLNGQQVAYNSATNTWKTLENLPVSLQPGINTLDITVLNDMAQGTPTNNTPNPSGVVSEVVGSGGQVYSATGGSSNSWRMVSGPPASPNPPPPTTTTNCYTTSCA
jgi:hypothetical protein